MRAEKKFFAALAVCVVALTFAQAAHAARIVSLAPTATEILFAIGAGDDVVAVTEMCDWPPEASGRALFADMMRPSLEEVARLSPDVVAISDLNAHLSDGLRAIGCEVVVARGGSVDDVASSIEEFGRVCGVNDAARDVAHALRRDMAALRAGTEGRARPRVLVVIGRDAADASFRSLYAAGRGSFYSELADAAGADNALDAGAAYVAMTREGVLRADPDVVIEMIVNDEQADAARASWSSFAELRAASEGHIAVISGTRAFRAGPRCAELAREMAAAMEAALR